MNNWPGPRGLLGLQCGYRGVTQKFQIYSLQQQFITGDQVEDNILVFKVLDNLSGTAWSSSHLCRNIRSIDLFPNPVGCKFTCQVHICRLCV